MYTQKSISITRNRIDMSRAVAMTQRPRRSCRWASSSHVLLHQMRSMYVRFCLYTLAPRAQRNVWPQDNSVKTFGIRARESRQWQLLIAFAYANLFFCDCNRCHHVARELVEPIRDASSYRRWRSSLMVAAANAATSLLLWLQVFCNIGVGEKISSELYTRFGANTVFVPFFLQNALFS